MVTNALLPSFVNLTCKKKRWLAEPDGRSSGKEMSAAVDRVSSQWLCSFTADGMNNPLDGYTAQLLAGVAGRDEGGWRGDGRRFWAGLLPRWEMTLSTRPSLAKSQNCVYVISRSLSVRQAVRTEASASSFSSVGMSLGSSTTDLLGSLTFLPFLFVTAKDSQRGSKSVQPVSKTRPHWAKQLGAPGRD